MQSADKYIRESIKEIYSQREASQISLLILETLYGLNLTDIILGKDNLPNNQDKIIDNIISQLKVNKPIQYILRNTEFMGLNFTVEEGVLIPRPETAELINLIIEQNNIASPSILDIGTGSGCIAISLADNISDADVTAFDISDKAIEIASLNAKSNNININIIKQDILNFDDSQYQSKFDIIVSNPPYICHAEKASMHNNVLDYEPELALFVSDDDPLLFYRTIVNHSLQILKPGGKLYFEINEAYGEETAQLLINAGFSVVKIVKDMQQKDRIVYGTLFNH